MIYQGISVARNRRAYLTILAIKRGILRNFEKKFKGRYFMGHSGTDFQLLLNSKSSKLPAIVFKKYVENANFEPKEKKHFFKFCVSIAF